MAAIRGVGGPILGKFRISAGTGLVTGAAGGSTIFSARFAPTAPVRALITDFRIKAQIITPFTAANEISVQAMVARSFTASDSGGISFMPTGLQGNMSSIDGQYTTAFTDMRVATTGALVLGTRTVDPWAFLFMPCAQPGASPTTNAYFETAIKNSGDARYSLNLQGQTGGVSTNAEGIVATILVAQGAAGVVRYCFDMEWVEYVTNSQAIST